MPQLAPAIRKVEQAGELVRHDERWKEVYADISLSASDEPEKPLAQLDAFLRKFPDTPRRTEVLALAPLEKRADGAPDRRRAKAR